MHSTPDLVSPRDSDLVDAGVTQSSQQSGQRDKAKHGNDTHDTTPAPTLDKGVSPKQAMLTTITPVKDSTARTTTKVSMTVSTKVKTALPSSPSTQDSAKPTRGAPPENMAVPPIAAVRATMLLRVPLKLGRAARHKTRLNALALWAAPGDAMLWLEVRPGGLLQVTGRAHFVDGQKWREVCSPNGSTAGYALESSLQWLDLVVPASAQKKTTLKETHRPPRMFEWAYVGVKAPRILANIGQCVAIEYDRLPDPDHIGLATFRMLDGRSRQAWLVHAQKTNPPEGHV